MSALQNHRTFVWVIGRPIRFSVRPLFPVISYCYEPTLVAAVFFEYRNWRIYTDFCAINRDGTDSARILPGTHQNGEHCGPTISTGIGVIRPHTYEVDDVGDE